MGTKDRTGRKLERLVAALEGIFAGTEAEIEAPCRKLVDRDTGRAREHDVVLTWKHGHHRTVMAIECRDRSRAVGVPDVEAFADKCAQTGVHNAVMVSSTGFRGTARKKAAARSITCLELAEVDEFDWMAMAEFVQYERQFGPIDARMMFKGAQPDALAAVYDAEGNELNAEKIAQLIANSVPADEPDPELGDLPLGIRIASDTDSEDGDMLQGTDEVVGGETYHEYDTRRDALGGSAGTYAGYDCTEDCGGHAAGYQWAEERGITDEVDCGGKSWSFREGCAAYAEGLSRTPLTRKAELSDSSTVQERNEQC